MVIFYVLKGHIWLNFIHVHPGEKIGDPGEVFSRFSKTQKIRKVFTPQLLCAPRWKAHIPTQPWLHDMHNMVWTFDFAMLLELHDAKIYRKW